MNSNETRIIVLSKKSPLTSGNLLSIARSFGEPIVIKETCYGLMIEGEKEAIGRAARALKFYSPYNIFTKRRGYCIGEKGKCRKGEDGRVSGAPRIGFHQLELESQLLSLVGNAMEAVDSEQCDVGRSSGTTRLTEEEARYLVRQVLSEDKGAML